MGGLGPPSKEDIMTPQNYMQWEPPWNTSQVQLNMTAQVRSDDSAVGLTTACLKTVL